MYVTNNQFSEKLNNGWKKSKWLGFFAFTSLILHCVHEKLKSYSSILLEFFMHAANNQFSDKFNNGQQKFKMADLLWFFAFNVVNFTLGAIPSTFFMYPAQIFYVFY